MPTKEELQQQVEQLEYKLGKEVARGEELCKRIEQLEHDAVFPKPRYLVVEMAERSFLIAKNIIGSKNYTKVATTQSRGQTEEIVNLLNKGEKK